MKQTVLRFGSFATLFIVLFFLATWLLFKNATEEDFKTQEFLGYTGIFLATSFAFFGIKFYRDKVNGGRISFGQGLKVGLLIILFPALAFGLLDVLYVTVINPDFYETYYNYQVNELRSSLSAAEFESRLKEMEGQKEMFTNPLFVFFLMFLTVLAIGLIVTVLSSLILKRKNQDRVALRTQTAN